MVATLFDIHLYAQYNYYINVAINMHTTVHCRREILDLCHSEYRLLSISVPSSSDAHNISSNKYPHTKHNRRRDVTKQINIKFQYFKYFPKLGRLSVGIETKFAERYIVMYLYLLRCSHAYSIEEMFLSIFLICG